MRVSGIGRGSEEADPEQGGGDDDDKTLHVYDLIFLGYRTMIQVNTARVGMAARAKMSSAQPPPCPPPCCRYVKREDKGSFMSVSLVDVGVPLILMAGRVSLDLARRQGACEDCDDEFATPGVMDPDLKRYWTSGKGGKLKIIWGTDGSMKRCISIMKQYFPKEPGGLCANLHKAATGEWPTEGGKAGIPS